MTPSGQCLNVRLQGHVCVCVFAKCESVPVQGCWSHNADGDAAGLLSYPKPPNVHFLCCFGLMCRVNKQLSLQRGTPSQIVLYVRFLNMLFLMRMLFYFCPPSSSSQLILSSLHYVQSHSSTPPSPPLLHFACFPTSFSALSLPPSLSLSLFLPLFFSAALSLRSQSLPPPLPVGGAMMLSWPPPKPFVPSLLRPHNPPSLPPDAINTQHRWVIAETYRLPLPLTLHPTPRLFSSLSPHVSPCSNSLPDLTRFPTSTLALVSRRPIWAKPGPVPGVVRPVLAERSQRSAWHFMSKNKTSGSAHNMGSTVNQKVEHHIH